MLELPASAVTPYAATLLRHCDFLSCRRRFHFSATLCFRAIAPRLRFHAAIDSHA